MYVVGIVGMQRQSSWSGERFMNTDRNNCVLIVTAVEAEKEAVLRGLGGRSGIGADHRFNVIAGGVGPAMAAASTAAALATGGYQLVISAGIGGGFVQREAQLGSIVLASALISADLGAESPEGFIAIDEMGFGTSRIEADRAYTDKLAARLAAAGLPVLVGSVLTVTTATGTAATAEAHLARYPDAVAEAMEGFGVASAALLYRIPVMELRTISNAIGPRDRASWRIPEALNALEAASAILKEGIS